MTDTRIFGLLLAQQKGEPIFFGGDGCALHDPFVDSSFIDLTNSENFDVLNGLKSKAPLPIIPDMTSNTSGGMTASASSTYTWSGGGPAWRAFDRDDASGWLNAASSPNPTLPAWLQIDCATQKNVGSYSIRTRPSASQTYDGFPIDFTFRGSNDGLNWTTIDTRSGILWANNEIKKFNITPANFRYYRLCVTASSTGNALITEFQIYSPHPVLEVQSAGIEATSVPQKTHMIILADNSPDVWMSRDNGTTFVPATVTPLYALLDGIFAYKSSIMFSVQPSGCVIKWRISSGSPISIDGVAMWCE